MGQCIQRQESRITQLGSGSASMSHSANAMFGILTHAQSRLGFVLLNIRPNSLFFGCSDTAI